MISSILILGTRNLWRNPRRTFTTSLSVAFGVCIVMVLVGSRQDTHDRIVANAAKSGPGMITVAPAGFFSEPSPAIHAPFSPSTLAAMAKIPGIDEVAPRIGVMANAYTPKNSTGAEVLGIAMEGETAASNLMLGSLVKGAKPAPGDIDGCLIGDTMAGLLGLELGNKLLFSTTDTHGQLVSNLLRVRGFFHTGSPELDGHFVVTTLALMRQTLNYAENDASLLAFFVAPGAPYGKLTASIEKVLHKVGLANLHVGAWREGMPDIAQAVDIDSSFNSIIVVMATLIIGTGVLNAMMFNVFDRRREFGIMLATGMSPATLVLMVAWEGLLLGFLGIAIGCLVAVPMYFYLHLVGIDLSHLVGDERDRTVLDPNLIIGCRLTLQQIAALAGSLLGISLVAGLYPALKAAWTVPIKVIRTG